MLCDDKSRTVFKKILNFKITYDYDFMQGFTNNFSEQYFDKELIPKIDDIVFLDGGGYVGDTVPSIIKYFKNYKKIYLVEPSGLHINIAKRDLKDIRDINYLEYGLSNKTVNNKIQNITNLKNNHNCNHNFQANNTTTIDIIFKDTKVDFIKLDIEGAEQSAIDGAIATIKRDKPILAICIYHKAEDWYKIPQKVLKIYPSYKVYLRHYMEGIYETVMYFIT